MGAPELKHNWARVALIVASAASFIVCVITNGIANRNVAPGLFLSTTGDVSDKYYLEITPAGWTFSIWGFIYTFQALFTAYTLSTICRRGIDNYLYLSPANMFPIPMFIAYIIVNIGNAAWIVLWDRELILASGIVIAFMAFFLILASAFAAWGGERCVEELKKNNLTKEVWFHRIMVQNALPFYATWVSIATLLNLAMILTYIVGTDQPMASTISLGILAADIVIWFIADIFFTYRYTNYIILPYAVIIVALSGSIDKNFVAWNRNSTFSVILLIVGVAAFIVKLIIMLWRHFRPMTAQVSTKEQNA